MIDFRYHIVSLIAVFLALAVGVVLGAGPLQGSIGDQLQVQIEDLARDKEELRAQLSEQEAENDRSVAFIDASADRLIDGSLDGVDVAVVELAGSDAAVVTALLERVEQAGGTVVSQLALASAWTDPSTASDRDAAAAEIGVQLPSPPGDDVPAAQVLGMGLGQALTEQDPLSSDGFSTGARGVYDALVSAELVTETQAPTGPADAVLVVAPAPGAEQDSDAAAATLEIELATVTGLAGRESVLVGTDDGETDLVDAVRADPEATLAVSTVDSVDTSAGQVIAPLALAVAADSGTVGHYGLDDGATAVLPPAVVPEPEPEPTDPPSEDEAATEESS